MEVGGVIMINWINSSKLKSVVEAVVNARDQGGQSLAGPPTSLVTQTNKFA
jgi:hypothetical protein